MTGGIMTVTFEPGLENEFETFKRQWFASLSEGFRDREGGGSGGWKEAADIGTQGERFSSFSHALKGMILWQKLQSTNLWGRFNLVI